MSAPQQPQLTLVELLGCIAAVTGASAGATWGGANYGFWGAVIGVPVGLVVGAVGIWALMVGCVVVIVPSAILFNYGPRKLWEFIRGRWEPPDEGPQQSPDETAP